MEESLASDVDSPQATDETNRYVDCIRLVEGGHVRRFETTVVKFDLVQYESNDGEQRSNKPLIFYAIERNNDAFVRLLLEMEVSLDKKYTVS